MRTTINYKGQTIKQNSEHRFYVNRFNDEYDGMVMFTSEARAKAYIDKHLTDHKTEIVWAARRAEVAVKYIINEKQ